MEVHTSQAIHPPADFPNDAAHRPKVFSYVVAVWLLCIIINLLLIPASNPMPHYDIALRDVGLLLSALALGRLTRVVSH